MPSPTMGLWLPSAPLQPVPTAQAPQLTCPSWPPLRQAYRAPSTAQPQTSPASGRAEGTSRWLHNVHKELAGISHGLLERLAAACQLWGDSGQLPDRRPPRWPAHHCVGLCQGVQWGEPWGNS
jgi:hypothetical protein